MAELDVSQMFYTNLLLLGFDPSAMEAKHGISFNKNLFSVPNRKAFESVTYFLFGRLDGARCKKEFRDCWPVMEKKDPQTFRKVCQTWLLQISKEDAGSRLPPVTPALLMTPGGDKFIRFMYCFSRYVLQHVAVNDYGADRSLFLCPEINPKINCSASALLQSIYVETCRQRQTFLDGNRKHEAIRKEWAKYTGELIMKYRQDIKLLKDYEVRLKNEQEKLDNSSDATFLASRGRHSGGTGRLSGGKTADIKNVERMWQKIDSVCEAVTKQQHIVDIVLDKASDECCIDSSKLDIKIPDILIQQCHEQLQKNNVDSLHTGGKMNLLNVIHLWNSALRLYLNKLHEVGVPDFSNDLPQVETSLQKHQSHSTEAEKLRLHLEFEFLPQLKQSVESLRQELDQKASSAITSHSSSYLQIPGVATLLPPTPPVSFEPADSPAAAELSRRYMLSNILRHDASQNSTPEGAILLKNDVDGKIMKKYRSKIPHREVASLKGGVLATNTAVRKGANTLTGSNSGSDRLKLQNMKRNILQEVNHNQNAEYQLKETLLTPLNANVGHSIKASIMNPSKTALFNQGLDDNTRWSPAHVSADAWRSSDTLQTNSQPTAVGYEDLLADQVANAVMIASPLLKESEICSHLSSDSRYSIEDASHCSIRDSIGPTEGVGVGERRRSRRSGQSRTLPLREQNIDSGPLSSTLDMEKSFLDDHHMHDIESSYRIPSSKPQRLRDDEILSVSGTRTPSSIHSDLSLIEHHLDLSSMSLHGRRDINSPRHLEMEELTPHGSPRCSVDLFKFPSHITAREVNTLLNDIVIQSSQSPVQLVSCTEELTPHVSARNNVDLFKFPSEATARKTNTLLDKNLISSSERQMGTPVEHQGGADIFRVPSQTAARISNIQLDSNLIATSVDQIGTPVEQQGSAVYDMKNSDTRQKILRFDCDNELIDYSKTPYQDIINAEVGVAWKTLMNTATPCLPVRKRVQHVGTIASKISYNSRSSPEGTIDHKVPSSLSYPSADYRTETISRLGSIDSDNSRYIHADLSNHTSTAQLNSPHILTKHARYSSSATSKSMNEVNMLNNSPLNGEFATQLYSSRHSNVKNDRSIDDSSFINNSHSESAYIDSILRRYKNFKTATNDISLRERSFNDSATEVQLNCSPMINRPSEENVRDKYVYSSAVTSKTSGKAKLADVVIGDKYTRSFSPVNTRSDRLSENNIRDQYALLSANNNKASLNGHPAGAEDGLHMTGLEDESFEDIHQMMMNLSTDVSPIVFRTTKGNEKIESSVVSTFAEIVTTESVPTATLIDFS